MLNNEYLHLTAVEFLVPTNFQASCCNFSLFFMEMNFEMACGVFSHLDRLFLLLLFIRKLKNEHWPCRFAKYSDTIWNISKSTMSLFNSSVFLRSNSIQDSSFLYYHLNQHVPRVMCSNSIRNHDSDLLRKKNDKYRLGIDVFLLLNRSSITSTTKIKRMES